jgi:hypothetical protein
MDSEHTAALFLAVAVKPCVHPEDSPHPHGSHSLARKEGFDEVFRLFPPHFTVDFLSARMINENEGGDWISARSEPEFWVIFQNSGYWLRFRDFHSTQTYPQRCQMTSCFAVVTNERAGANRGEALFVNRFAKVQSVTSFPSSRSRRTVMPTCSCDTWIRRGSLSVIVCGAD